MLFDKGVIKTPFKFSRFILAMVNFFLLQVQTERLSQISLFLLGGIYAYSPSSMAMYIVFMS